MKAFVTGGAGFIGGHVVRELLGGGYEVRVLVLSGEDTRNIDGLDIETIEGNVLDKGRLAEAMSGCGWVFHLAAIYAIWLPRPEVMAEVNIEGTRNVMETALESGVERVVHTSSIAAFGGQGLDRDATEESGFACESTGDLYSITKRESQKIALSYVEKGLDVVVAAPCGPFGPGDVGPTPTGRFLLSVVNMPICPIIDTVSNMVDARDVAKGHVLAAEKGKKGEAYLLGNKNVSQEELARIVLKTAGVKKPMVKLPTWGVKGGAYALKWWADHVSHKAPLITPPAAEIAARGLRADCSKAFNQLGLPCRPFEETIRDALAWFAQNGYISDYKAAQNVLKN